MSVRDIVKIQICTKNNKNERVLEQHTNMLQEKIKNLQVLMINLREC